MSNTFWNDEDETFIKCPYCGAKYEPSYEDTIIGGEIVNCYTEDIEEYVCDACGKKFTMYGYQSEWRYVTETINGEMTEEEHEKGKRDDGTMIGSCENCATPDSEYCELENKEKYGFCGNWQGKGADAE